MNLIPFRAGIKYLSILQEIDTSQLPKHLRNVVEMERVRDYVMFNILDFINQNIRALGKTLQLPIFHVKLSVQ